MDPQFVEAAIEFNSKPALYQPENPLVEPHIALIWFYSPLKCQILPALHDLLQELWEVLRPLLRNLDPPTYMHTYTYMHTCIYVIWNEYFSVHTGIHSHTNQSIYVYTHT